MKLSIIIPTYNEESCIEKTLEDLYEHHNPDEVILVDGGSEDRTLLCAREYPEVEIYSSEKGRAKQMNLGAKKATGDGLLFLHADTELPMRALDLIKETLEGQIKAGRFRMRFDDRSFSLRMFETYTHLPCFSYGDQCFFMKREVFEELGGYRPDVPFEDVDFYKRLSQLTKPIILKEKVTTSARRFTKVGRMRQKFINLFLIGLYYAGFNVLPLKEKYYTDVR